MKTVHLVTNSWHIRVLWQFSMAVPRPPTSANKAQLHSLWVVWQVIYLQPSPKGLTQLEKLRGESKVCPALEFSLM